MKKLIKYGKQFGMALALIALMAAGSACSGDRYNKSTGEVVDDAAITTKVKSALLADKEVSGLAVKVKTYRGSVQLSGFVKSEAEKMKAAEVAQRVEGVQTVNNDIIVK